MMFTTIAVIVYMLAGAKATSFLRFMTVVLSRGSNST